MRRFQFKKFNAARVLMNISMGITTTLLLLVCFWAFYPYKIIEYKVDFIEPTKTEYVVGEPLTYRISFCKYGDYTGTVLRFVRDTVVYSFPVIQSSIEDGCRDFISSSNQTPNVPSGEYIFENEVIYKVNPIREVRYHIESTPFNIINPN